jgi:ectoine hydroxylase-related dioxygenase (phytanoyl-CoA dioxygenase family)
MTCIVCSGDKKQPVGRETVTITTRNVVICDQQIAQYQRDGALVIRGVLGREQLDLLERGVEEAHKAPGARYTKVQSPQGEGETLLEMFPSLHCASLQNLLRTSVIPEIAGRLMAVPCAQLILDQTFYKESGYINPTPWHQDTPFLRVRGDDMVRVWLTCDVSPRDLTVQVVRGSHRWNVVYNTRSAQSSRVVTADQGKEFTFEGIGNDASPSAPDVARYRDSFEILSWDVQPGDALVFNGNILHGADGRANHPSKRRAFTSMWGGPELRYHVPKGNATPTLAEINHVSVPHGARIGDYPEAFPIGWREGSDTLRRRSA